MHQVNPNQRFSSVDDGFARHPGTRLL